MTASALYRGTLLHARRDEHARRTFRYPVYVASIDPDELPDLDARLRLFSHNRRNVFALHDRDYEPATAELLAANGLPAPVHRRLVTNLRVLGYVFNPVSFHLGYDAAGRLSSVIAEVNNTYGGRFRYVLGPTAEVARRGGRVGYRHVRELFVSPFLHGPATYELWFPEQIDPPELAIAMHVDRPSAATDEPLARAELTAQAERPDQQPEEPPIIARMGTARAELTAQQQPHEHPFSAHIGAAHATEEGGALGRRFAPHTEPGDRRGDRTSGGFDPRFRARRGHLVRGPADRRVFVAHLEGTRTPLSDRALAAAAVRYPLMTLQVIGIIHYEALKLHLLGVPYRRPGRDHRPIGWTDSVASPAHRSVSMK